MVRILARGAFSRVVRILARGTPCSRILRIAPLGIAPLGIPQQLISVRFGKCDNFPDRFGSDMQKYRFNIGRFGLLFGTDYIGSYCLEGPIHFGIGIGPGARTGTNRPNASSGGSPEFGSDEGDSIYNHNIIISGLSIQVRTDVR